MTDSNFWHWDDLEWHVVHAEFHENWVVTENLSWGYQLYVDERCDIIPVTFTSLVVSGVCWNVIPCILVDRYYVSKEPAASILKFENSSGLNMEKVHSSKMLVPIYQTTWHNIPEDSKLNMFSTLSSCLLHKT
jgi:hypothetical protein